MATLPFRNAPIEDDGATTAHRYLFQYCCAAARLLATMTTGRECELVCEWHEDFLVVGDHGVEAVSIKHREDNRPAWSIATLAGDDGNLQHLLETFRRGEGVECCFETNRAHKADALWVDDMVVRDQARADLASRLNATRAEVDDFLNHLVITAPPVPERHHIVATYASAYAAPALDSLGLTLAPTRAIQIACRLVADASRDRIPAEAWSEVLAAAPTDRAAALARHRLEARRVTSSELYEALKEAERLRVPRLGATSEEVPPETTMTRKLEEGGLGPSVVDTARRRRRMWYSHRAASRDLDEREAELRSLEEWVQDQANAAENLARRTGYTGYGTRMYDDLMMRLRAADILPSGTREDDSDPALLSGAAFELTDACSVWWSPRFDLGHSDGNT